MSKRLTTSAIIATLLMVSTVAMTAVQGDHAETATIPVMMGG